jgi:GH24 family phage-related lysozyme (muramidase)
MASILEELEEGDVYAWAALAFLGYVLLNTWRDMQASGQGSFSDTAPADPALDSAVDVLAPMHISPAGQLFIKQQEGWTPRPKTDAAGQEVGWGHTIKAGDNLSYPLSAAVGEQLFQADVADAEQIVNSTVTAALTQNQFDALGDLAFNSGYAAFGSNSTLLTKLNAGDYAGAAQAFSLYNKSQGQVSPDLTQRRGADANMFSS